MGALSVINESEVSSYLNMGDNNSYETGQLFYPILFNIRNGIEQNAIMSH